MKKIKESNTTKVTEFICMDESDEFTTINQLLEEGKELLKSLGIEGDYVGIGHCVLGYVDGEYPGIPERKDNWVYYVE